jgi:beta-glucosidase
LTQDGFQPQWAFGHGLTYSDLQTAIDTVLIPEYLRTDSVTVLYTITNESMRDATQAIDVFVTDEYAAGISPRMRVHVGFDNIQVPAKSTVKNSFKLPPQSFQFVDSEGVFHAEPGDFTIELAGEIRTINLGL